MRALVVLKVGAGKGTHEEAHDVISREFKAAGIQFEILIAGDKDAVDDVVRSRLDDHFDLVVVAGGDGTVARAFDALQGTSIPLAIIPTGTGNIIAREFDIPVDIEKSVQLITSGPRTRTIDGMKIAGRVYVLSAGVGINAAVVARTSKKSKSRFGRFAYIATILGMFGFRPRFVEITVDGESRRFRAVEVSVNNCGTLAKTVYPPGPDIRPDDGRVDIWVLGMESAIDYLQYLVGVLVGRRRKALCLTARERVVIDSRVSMATQADGDIIGTTPLEVEVLPASLTVLVPASDPA